MDWQLNAAAQLLRPSLSYHILEFLTARRLDMRARA
jgi:hypothetical protein